MEKQEWQAYVKQVISCDYPIPLNLVNDYDDWKCRSNVGRMLYILKDIEGAMAVLATVKDIQPDMQDAPEYGLSEAEHKVLCLRDIAEIVWTLTGTGDAPVFYLKEADKLCRTYEHVFRSANRGAIWVRQLEIMRSCGQGTQAVELARAELSVHKEDGVNAYAFYALRFLAESLAEAGEYQKACLLIMDAYGYFPQNEACKRDIEEAMAHAEASERYAALHHCTTIQYQPWEQGKVPTLEDVRKLQEENFKRREAAKQVVDTGISGVNDLLK